MIANQLFNSLKSLVDSRVYPDKIPGTSAFPAICYQMISEVPDYTTAGASGWSEMLIQVDLYVKNPDERQALSNQVFEALDRLPCVAIHQNSMDMYEDDTCLYRRLMRFRLMT